MSASYWKMVGESIAKGLGEKTIRRLGTGGKVLGRTGAVLGIGFLVYELYKNYKENIENEPAYQEMMILQAELEKWVSVISCIGGEPAEEKGLFSTMMGAFGDKADRQADRVGDSVDNEIDRETDEAVDKQIGKAFKTAEAAGATRVVDDLRDPAPLLELLDPQRFTRGVQVKDTAQLTPEAKRAISRAPSGIAARSRSARRST